MVDWLMHTALDAIVEQNPDLADWREEKLVRYKDGNRLESLFFICCILAPENQHVVAKRLGVDPEDLLACARVLHRI